MTRKTTAELKQQEQLEDMRSVLASAEGRRVLQRLLDHCHVDQVSFGSGLDAAEMAFLEGQRNEGLYLKSLIIEAEPQAWLMMQHDQLIQDKTDERTTDRNTGASGTGNTGDNPRNTEYDN